MQYKGITLSGWKLTVHLDILVVLVEQVQKSDQRKYLVVTFFIPTLTNKNSEELIAILIFYFLQQSSFFKACSSQLCK